MGFGGVYSLHEDWTLNGPLTIVNKYLALNSPNGLAACCQIHTDEIDDYIPPDPEPAPLPEPEDELEPLPPVPDDEIIPDNNPDELDGGDKEEEKYEPDEEYIPVPDEENE